MRSAEGFTLDGVGAGTTEFVLEGGMYAIASASSGAGTIDLTLKDRHGIAHAVATQITATAGFQTGLYLPPGTYQIVIVGFTANYVSVTRVPIE